MKRSGSIGVRGRLLGMFYIAVFVIMAGSTAVRADTEGIAAENEGVYSSNIGRQDYILWNEFANSYLNLLEDGSMERIEYIDPSLYVEEYSREGIFESSRQIDCELPVFGGCYCGENYQYLMFGAENLSEDDSAEVFRIVKYDRQWNRLGSASLYGGNTTTPFRIASVRMTESGKYLYIHTNHEMYRADDGKRHQKNLSIVVDTEQMKITDEHTAIAHDYGYVSHSFNQFIISDGADIITADHGDAYPRAIMLYRYTGDAGQSVFSNPESVDVLDIWGNIGANITGASLGGLEASTEGYLLAGNSVAQDETYTGGGVRNIFVSLTPRDNFSKEGTTLRWLTDYPKGTDVSTPQLVKISDNSFLMLWTVDEVVNYVFLDEAGNPTGDIRAFETAALSDCQLKYRNGVVNWYVTDYSQPVFFSLDVSDEASVKLSHTGMVSLEEADIQYDRFADYVYTGEAYTPSVKVWYGGKYRTEGRDYTVSYENNINAGTAKIIVTGIGLFGGKKEETFQIEKGLQIMSLVLDGVEINSNDLVTMQVGDKKQLFGTGYGRIVYGSQNEHVVRILEDGTVTAVGGGNTTVSAYAYGDENYYGYGIYFQVHVDGPEYTEESTGNENNGGISDGTGDFTVSDSLNTGVNDNDIITEENAEEAAGEEMQPVSRKNQTITVSKKASKTVTLKFLTLKKKSQSFSISAKAKGRTTYAVTKYPKSGRKYITVSKSGKVTLKKKAKKGTYVITVTAAATSKYKKATKKIQIKVK